MIEVVAALLKDGDKLLICQRPVGKNLALYWEFAGGKIEKGESAQQALKRECKEELDVEIDVGELYATINHEYDDFAVKIHFFNATLKAGERIKIVEHNDARWIDVGQIDEFEFCPADEEIINKIKNDMIAHRRIRRGNYDKRNS